MKEFKYDVVQLIQSVQDRPCLWNKDLEVYKDRLERRKAWEEIFTILEDGYESMSAEDQRLTGELILNKWTNIRDTFVRTLRMKMGKTRRKYIYYEHLEFLVKTVTQEEEHNGESSIEEASYNMKEEHDSEEDIVPRKRTKRIEVSDESGAPNTSRSDFHSISHSSKKRPKKKDFNEKEVINKTKEFEVKDIDFVGVDEVNNITSDHRLMNEDEAFFASLLPTVVRYNEDEKLEFRIEVLGVMKRIKKNRNWCAEDQ